jgi:hypothetical protein
MLVAHRVQPSLLCRQLIGSSSASFSKIQEGDGELKNIVTINLPPGIPGQLTKDHVGDQAPIPEETSNPWVDPLSGELGYRVLFGALNEEDGVRYAALVEAQSLNALVEPLAFAAFEVLPTTAVISEKDLAFKPETQDKVYELVS